MSFDPKVYRNSKDGIGSPADDKATDASSPWTLVSLAKGIYYLLGTTGITVNGGATAAKQDTGNTTLAAIDGHVDGIESLITSTNTKLDTLHTDLATTLAGYVDGLETLNGAVIETAPATDTASSGLNGRLQRIAQRITSLIALVPASLGQKAMASAFAVSIASDQSTFPVHPGASAASGGIASTARLLSAAGSSGDATNVKASAGRLYAIQGYNASASVRYLKLYNSASAPTAGSGTPVKTLALPPGVGFAFDWPHGYYFSTGIGFTLVTGSADNSSTSVTAADILGLNLDYT